jgi:hypothetical protein
MSSEMPEARITRFKELRSQKARIYLFIYYVIQHNQRRFNPLADSPGVFTRIAWERNLYEKQAREGRKSPVLVLFVVSERLICGTNVIMKKNSPLTCVFETKFRRHIIGLLLLLLL